MQEQLKAINSAKDQECLFEEARDKVMKLFYDDQLMEAYELVNLIQITYINGTLKFAPGEERKEESDQEQKTLEKK